MKTPRLTTMTDLPLGIALLVTIIAVAVYLIHFHLMETLIVYGVSFAAGIVLALRWAYVAWRQRKNR